MCSSATITAKSCRSLRQQGKSVNSSTKSCSFSDLCIFYLLQGGTSIGGAANNTNSVNAANTVDQKRDSTNKQDSIDADVNQEYDAL